MTTPPLPMAAEMRATWRGVIRTSYWPIEDWASCGGLRSAGTLLGVTRIGIDRASPTPNLAACARSASAPICMPSQPNAGLHEIRNASVIVTLPLLEQGRCPSLGRPTLVCGRSSTAGPGSTLWGVNLPPDSAAAAVTSLKVDPGG